jgi:hypothetical protein
MSPDEFASSIVGFDPSALTAHTALLQYTCIQFALLSLKTFLGLETASKGVHATQPRKPIRIWQSMRMLQIQILLVGRIELL